MQAGTHLKNAERRQTAFLLGFDLKDLLSEAVNMTALITVIRYESGYKSKSGQNLSSPVTWKLSKKISTQPNEKDFHYGWK